MQSYGPQPTGASGWHPYAASGGAPGAGFRQGYSGKLYGIDEEVWLAHHYGPKAARYGKIHRNYGSHIVEERVEQERERVERMTKHYKLRSTAGYFMRRDMRIKKQAAEEAERRKKEGKGDEDDSGLGGCVIS